MSDKTAAAHQKPAASEIQAMIVNQVGGTDATMTHLRWQTGAGKRKIDQARLVGNSEETGEEKEATIVSQASDVIAIDNGSLDTDTAGTQQ